MKIKLMLVLLVFIGTGLMFSQSITVTAPAGGATWYKGDSPTITWSKSGIMDANVKITLRNADASLHLVITMSTPNDGSYPWTIPASIPNGTYLMRVKTVDNAVTDDSPAFAIATRTESRGSITVTAPASGTTWHTGSDQTVTWSKTGSMDSNVKITLRNMDGSLRKTVTMSTPNDGSYMIPANFFSDVDNGNYRIRVKTTDNEVSDDSDQFTLSAFLVRVFIPTLEALKIHTIEVLEPNGGKSLALNSTMRILWKPNNLTNNVKILLMKNGAVFGTIAPSLAPGRISEEWTIGRTVLKTAVPGSGFKIRVEELNTGVFDESDRSFSIEEPRNIDLSGFVLSHSSRDHGQVVRLNVKVRVNNFGGDPLPSVPVHVSLRAVGDDPGSGETKTKYLENVTYRGHSYEYSLSFDFRLHNTRRDQRRLDRIATVEVDPDDTFRDRRRMNNKSTYTFLF